METISFSLENDFKLWMKEAIKEYLMILSKMQNTLLAPDSC